MKPIRTAVIEPRSYKGMNTFRTNLTAVAEIHGKVKDRDRMKYLMGPSLSNLNWLIEHVDFEFVDN